MSTPPSNSADPHPATPHPATPSGRPTTPTPPGRAPDHAPPYSLLFPRPPATTGGAGVPVPATDPEAAAVRPPFHPPAPRPPAG
ncbi:hypothetical protein L6E12_07055, partial [Actinokineospora sp. PR83]|nr:hypothetical protein [Actinokineospora sp. PR83]